VLVSADFCHAGSRPVSATTKAVPQERMQARRRVGSGWILALAIAAIVIWLVAKLPSTEAGLQGLMLGISLSALYVLLALGLTLLFGMMHIVNFAHGALYMIGAYVTYELVERMGVSYALALPITILGFGIFGALVQAVLYNRVRRSIEASLVVFIALQLVLTNGTLMVFGGDVKTVNTVIAGVARIGGVSISLQRLAIVPIAAVLVGLLYLLLYRTQTGQAMRAIEQNHEAATLQGVNVSRITVVAFAVGFGLAGTAGALVAPIDPINTEMGDPVLLTVFIIIIIGGLGSPSGAILGAFVVGLIQTIGTLSVGADTTELLLFVLLILFLLYKPTGLRGHEPA
jgi:branched-chain amino acid transport system permease protein